jgi:hypothetical protein
LLFYAAQEELEKRKAALAQQRDSQKSDWRSKLNTVLQMRAAGVTDEASWSTVLCESFKLTLPVTPYRSYSPAQIINK